MTIRDDMMDAIVVANANHWRPAEMEFRMSRHAIDSLRKAMRDDEAQIFDHIRDMKQFHGIRVSEVDGIYGWLLVGRQPQ